MNQPIHLIKRWSGVTSDEAPLCGADADDPEVWGARTTDLNLDAVTCDTCRRLARIL